MANHYSIPHGIFKLMHHRPDFREHIPETSRNHQISTKSIAKHLLDFPVDVPFDQSWDKQ
jgi:hypothetical protein